jgi:hypothetical protein
MTFGHSPVETVSKREFLKVRKNIILNFVNGKVGRSLEGSFRVNRDNISFIRNNRVELIVNNVGAIEFDLGRLDDIDNGSGFFKRGQILTNLVEGDGNVLTNSTTQLSLGLITENNDIGRRGLGNDSTGSLGNTRVNTTTKTTIRRRGNDKSFTFFSSLGLGIGKESYYTSKNIEFLDTF